MSVETVERGVARTIADLSSVTWAKVGEKPGVRATFSRQSPGSNAGFRAAHGQLVSGESWIASVLLPALQDLVR